MDALVERVRQAQANEEVVSIAFIGNVVDVWKLSREGNLRTLRVQTRRHCTILGQAVTTGLISATKSLTV
ncbi:hypothetical protein P4S64_18160 [Vibrio sp. M60_M31a]